MGADLVPQGHGENPSPEWLAQLVENQKKELELKAQDLELQKQKDNNNLDYAKLALAAQERDRTDERGCARQTRKDVHRLVIAIVLVVATLVGLAVVMGKDQVALEIIKAIIFLVSGGAGGYGIGRARNRSQEATQPSGQEN